MDDSSATSMTATRVTSVEPIFRTSWPVLCTGAMVNTIALQGRAQISEGLVGQGHRVMAQHGVDLPLHLLDLPVGPRLEAKCQIRVRVRGAHETPAPAREDHARAVRIDCVV